MDLNNRNQEKYMKKNDGREAYIQFIFQILQISTMLIPIYLIKITN